MQVLRWLPSQDIRSVLLVSSTLNRAAVQVAREAEARVLRSAVIAIGKNRRPELVSAIKQLDVMAGVAVVVRSLHQLDIVRLPGLMR